MLKIVFYISLIFPWPGILGNTFTLLLACLHCYFFQICFCCLLSYFFLFDLVNKNQSCFYEINMMWRQWNQQKQAMQYEWMGENPESFVVNGIMKERNAKKRCCLFVYFTLLLFHFLSDFICCGVKRASLKQSTHIAKWGMCSVIRKYIIQCLFVCVSFSVRIWYEWMLALRVKFINVISSVYVHAKSAGVGLKNI